MRNIKKGRTFRTGLFSLSGVAQAVKVAFFYAIGRKMKDFISF